MAGLLNISHNFVLNQWRKLFENNIRSIQAHEHWQYVERLGLPTHKNEYWKHTPLKRLFAHRFTKVSLPIHSISNRQLNRISIKLDSCRLVFINGHFLQSLSDNDTDLWKVDIEYGANRQPLPAPIQSEFFLHLTESLSDQTTRIYLPIGKIAKKPLYLLHISYGSDNKDMLNTLHYRHHIDIASGAYGQVIEHFISYNQDPEKQTHFIGARSTINIGNNAKLSHIKLVLESHSNYHFAHNDIRLGRDAVASSSAFIWGAGLTHHQTSVQLNGENSTVSINSLMIPSNQDISDIRTYLEHNNGYCHSRQLHKIIATDRSQGVFHGLIKVGHNALKTDSKMTNNNLLLNKLAKVHTKPHLEIYADDVKCSHGATVGNIDDEQMFYLRSRGIPRKEAIKAIIYAFSAAVTDHLNNDAIENYLLDSMDDTLQEVNL